MTINGLSDIHGNLYNNIPKCDILCICGDIVSLNNQRDINKSSYWFYNKFFNWINKLNCSKVIIVPGNHDFYLENKYKEDYDRLKANFRIQTNNKAILLIDESYVYNNVKFYGSPWIRPIDFQEDKWAFSAKLNSNNKLNNIPQDTDILITHDSPLHNNLLYEKAKNIKYHLYGHWHSDLSDTKNNRYNCSILTDNYNFKKKFILPKISINMEYNVKDLNEILDKINSKILEDNNDEEINRLTILKLLIEDKIDEIYSNQEDSYDYTTEIDNYMQDDSDYEMSKEDYKNIIDSKNYESNLSKDDIQVEDE